MQRLRLFKYVVFALAGILKADVAYVYTGNLFTQANLAGVTTSDKVSVRAVFAVPLAPSLNGVDVKAQLVDWSMSAGAFQTSKLAGSVLNKFDVSTDSSGRIIGWAVISEIGITAFIYTCNNDAQCPGFQEDHVLDLFKGAGVVFNNPGMWTGPFLLHPDAHQVAYISNLVVGDSYLNLTNTGGVNGFDPAGSICVNAYAFDPSEEMVSCCSCLVTPDGMRSLSAKQDLLSNTLTPGVPDSIVIKLIASAPIANCNPASPTNSTLALGMRAWSTSLHQNTTTGRYQMNENVFQSSPLSDSELSKLTSYCGFIQANGSGFGICKSCRLGALGGAQQ